MSHETQEHPAVCRPGTGPRSLTLDGLMIAFGEELHGLGGAQRRAQQPLSVRVLSELPQDAGVGSLECG